MKRIYFEIVNSTHRKSEPCGMLSFSPDEGFRIELSENATVETVPAMFVPFIQRGEKVINDKWARRWVQERIPPPGRQNLGEILNAHGLNEYDELTLLRTSQAKSSQDDFIVREVQEGNSHAMKRRQGANRENLGRFIRNRREALRLSQSELARKMGIDQPALSRIEAGKTNATFDLLTDIAEHLELEDIPIPCSFERFLWNPARQRLFDAIQLVSCPLAFTYMRAVAQLERYSTETPSAFIDSRIVTECILTLCDELLDESCADDIILELLELRARPPIDLPSPQQLIDLLDALEHELYAAFDVVFELEERLNHLIAHANRTDAKGNFEKPLEHDIEEARTLGSRPIVSRILQQHVKNPLWDAWFKAERAS